MEPKWKLTIHWTVTGYAATAHSLKYYHGITEGNGRMVPGKFKPEDNIPPLRKGQYAPHTEMNNSYNIGLAIAAMEGAVRYPDRIEFGPSPITEAQFEAHCRNAAEFAAQYRIPVERGRIDTHAEVEANRGINQDGKWDIIALQFKPDVRGARAVGDYMRKRISFYLSEMGEGIAPLALPEHIPANYPTIQIGDRGPIVKIWQQYLHEMGYFPGKIDGIFGKRTRGPSLAYQADNGLRPDGVIGPRTWATQKIAAPMPLRDITIKDLDDSGTLKDLSRSDRLADGAAVVSIGKTVQMVKDQTDQAAEVIAKAQGIADQGRGLWEAVLPYWPIAAIAVVYLVWRGMNQSTRMRRLKDAITGAHVGR